MVAEQLISPVVPVLSAHDTGDRAMQMMEQNELPQLPLTAEDKYIALIQEDELLNLEEPDKDLESTHLLQYRPAILASNHPFEALRLMYQQNLSVLPVVDNDNTYLGAITRNEIFKYIAENSGLNNPGGIIVLEVAPRNYSLYEIARICESEDVLIINTQLYSNTATGKLEVTLKTNRTNLDAVAASLERYGIKVLHVFGEAEQKDDIISRYNLLMNYINM